MPAFENYTRLPDQRPLTLPIAKRGAFFDPHFRALGGVAESRKDGGVAVELHRIIAPVSGGDHAAVEVENAGEFGAVETDLQGGAVRKGED